jgi:transposase
MSVCVFAVRAEELFADRPELIAVVGPLLKARKAIEQQTDDLDRKVLKLARYDAQIRRFMTVPCFKATIDDPTRRLTPSCGGQAPTAARSSSALCMST